MYHRVQRGTPLDVTLSRQQGHRWTGPWTGPSDLDLSKLTLENGRQWLVIKLQFSRLALQRWEITRNGVVGDEISVLLDGDGNRNWDREVFMVWGQQGGLLSQHDDQVLRCLFDPRANPATRTVIMQIPRDCFPLLKQASALAHINSSRRKGPVTWIASDDTGWTDVAAVGEAVALRDPTT